MTKQLKNGNSKNLILSESIHLTGKIERNITILKGANVQLHGTVIGNVTLRAGSELFIHGTVNGDVINEGGDLRVFGKVTGKVTETSGKSKHR